MTASLPLITVAICSYNRCDYLLDTLTDVNRFKAAPEHAEVVVINNNSTDGTEDMLERFEWTSSLTLRTFNESKQGLSHARNRAIKEAQGRYVLFLDDDVYAEPEFLRLWVDELTAHPHLSGAGGRIIVHFDGEEPRWFPPILHSILGHHFPYGNAQQYSGRAYPTGAHMLIKKDWFQKRGAFNPLLGRNGKVLGGGEEKDVFTKMKSNGDALWFFPKCVIKHRIGTSRLSRDYVMRQAFGMGAGDRIRCENSKDVFNWNWLQFIKVLGTIAYGFIYMLSGKFSATAVLFQFRYELIRGFYAQTEG
jgi:glycosyltransferase involved in cell wall biosynthesis